MIANSIYAHPKATDSDKPEGVCSPVWGQAILSGNRLGELHGSPEFYVLIGYSREEYLALPQRADDGFRLAAQEDARKALAQVEKSGRLATRLWIRRSDGQRVAVWFEGALKNERTLDFRCADVTPLCRHIDQLQDALLRLDTICDLSGELMFDWDSAEDRLICFGSAAQRWSLAGQRFDPDELLSPGGIVCEEDMAVMRQLIKRLLNMRGPASARLRLQLEGTGNGVWHEVKAAPLLLSDGVMHIVGRAADIDYQTRELHHLTVQVERDALTGLYNNAASKRMIAACFQAEPDVRHLLLVIDLDDFKRVNDCLGHAVGDRVLRRIAQALRGRFRGSDILGRLGGDEFIVLMRHAAPDGSSELKAQSICEEIAGILGQEFNGAALSAGAAMFPDDGLTFEQLFEHADAALYCAKKAGKGRCMLYRQIH